MQNAEQREEKERLGAEQREKQRLEAEHREIEAREHLEAERRQKEEQERLEKERREAEACDAIESVTSVAGENAVSDSKSNRSPPMWTELKAEELRTENYFLAQSLSAASPLVESVSQEKEHTRNTQSESVESVLSVIRTNESDREVVGALQEPMSKPQRAVTSFLKNVASGMRTALNSFVRLPSEHPASALLIIVVAAAVIFLTSHMPGSKPMSGSSAEPGQIINPQAGGRPSPVLTQTHNPSAQSAIQSTYVVQPSESLEDISQKLYGTRDRWKIY
jgi:hypothetical protein